MVISKISGGLGNQLFQYAAGKCLALHRSTQLLLDTSYFAEEGLRNFELGSFNINLKIADRDLVENYITRSVPGKIRDKILPVQFRKVYKEPPFHFDRNFFNAASDVYLKGYWQSEKYFNPVKE